MTYRRSVSPHYAPSTNCMARGRSSAWPPASSASRACTTSLRPLPTNARGGYSRQIKRMLAKVPADRICEIAFEDDIHAFYRLCDLFVHTPIGPRMEGFGQVFVEPLMARVPAIFTRSGVAAEFPDEPPVARFVPFRDSAQIHAAMKSLLTDERARQMLIRNGRRLVDDHFAIAPMVRHMERLYQICATGVMP